MADRQEDEERLASAGWTYRRATTNDVVDLGTVQGRDVGLPAHCHDEDQITFALDAWSMIAVTACSF